MPPFKHENLLARTSQISGVDEAIVTSADYNYVIF
jgi:hypothetical protein